MSEEEKTLIFAKHYIKDNEGVFEFPKKELEILVNLIEKQNNRLEQLEKENIEKLKAIEELGRDFEIIQHEHDRLDKRNNELIEENKRLEKENESLVAQYEYQGAIMVNEYMPLETIKELFIPKSVIREKIEELENYIQENSDEQGYWGSKNPDEIYNKIDVLEELLGDEQ